MNVIRTKPEMCTSAIGNVSFSALVQTGPVSRDQERFHRELLSQVSKNV